MNESVLAEPLPSMDAARMNVRSVLLETPPSIADPVEPDVESILPKVELIESDGEPMESEWHVRQTHLLIQILDRHFGDRPDCYYAGNMFLYYSEEQARNRDFKGPDFFFVGGDTHRLPMRPYWALWLENNRTPDAVIELCSPTTIQNDYGEKREVYERVLRIPDYFCYDRDRGRLDGWRLDGKRYRALSANEHGRLWSEEMQLWVGVWRGAIGGNEDVWLRFFDANGDLVLDSSEANHRRADDEKRRADDEKRRADDEKRRADDEKRIRLEMESELERMRERLAALKTLSESHENGERPPPT